MGSAIVRFALTVEGLLFVAIGAVGLLATGGRGGDPPLLPDSPLTNAGLLVLGVAVTGAAQRPRTRRLVAWVQAIGITARLVSAATGHPVQLPWKAGPSALVGTLLIALALFSLSATAAERPPTQVAGRGGRRR